LISILPVESDSNSPFLYNLPKVSGLAHLVVCVASLRQSASFVHFNQGHET
jgi:hypothetical protein